MAQIKMEIQADGVDDFHQTLRGLLIGDAPVKLGASETVQSVVEAPVAEKAKPAPRSKKAEPAPAAPASLPTVEQATAAADATVAMSEGDGSSAGVGVGPATANITATPEDRQSPASDASYEDVKQALIALMDKKSASVVQSLLKDHFGVPAISQLDKSRYGEAKAKLTEWANG